MKRFENCAYEDLPVEKKDNYIKSSENTYPKLKYEARPPKSGKAGVVDIWSYLRQGQDP